MIKRRPRLVAPGIINQLAIRQTGGENITTNGTNFMTNWIYPFFAHYYMLIIIVLGLLLFLYWRYRTKLDEDKIINTLYSAQVVGQSKQPLTNPQMMNPMVMQQQMVNNQLFQRQMTPQMPKPQMMNPQMIYPQQTNPYSMPQMGGCTSCSMQKDPYKFNEKTNDLVYRNTKGYNEQGSSNYYGMSITEPNDINMSGDGFTPSNGVGDFYFPLN